MMAWLRVDSLPDRPQSLVMGDGLGTGDVQWYISRWGELGFGVHIGKRGDPTGWRFLHSDAVFTPENLGAWVCVASVYDNSTDTTVTHYFPTVRLRSPARAVGCANPASARRTFEIGNWALRDGEQWRAGIVPRNSRDSARNLQGRIDEVAILSAPLSAEEVRRQYEAGKVDQATTLTIAKETHN